MTWSATFVWLSLHDLVMWTTMAVASVRLSLNSETPIMAPAMVNAFAEKENSIHETDARTLCGAIEVEIHATLGSPSSSAPRQTHN